MVTNKQIYIGSPLRIKEYRDMSLCERLAEIIQKLGFVPYLPHKDTGDPDKEMNEDILYRKNILALDNSAFAIFDITHPSHGVGMEIEYAILNMIDFICIAEKGSIISKMVRGSVSPSNIIFYSNISELQEKLKKGIKNKQQLNERKGKLITLEGIDFTGKSSISKRIVNKLNEKNEDAILVTDPPSIQPWQELKQFFETQEKISKLSEAFLLLAARLDNYERVVKNALKHGKIVISDRYTDSWLAYQSHRLKPYFGNRIEQTLNFLIQANSLFIRNSLLASPDITILIVDEPEYTLKRIEQRGTISKYEIIEIQKTVQNMYLKLAKKNIPRFRTIEAKGKGMDTVFKEVYRIIRDFME